MKLEPVPPQTTDVADDLRRAIEESRRQVTSSLDDVQDKISEGIDWKGWVRKHPLEAVGAAFFVGFVFGARPYL